MSNDDALMVRRVRQASGVQAGSGPSDECIAAAIHAFAAKFNYWYGRVMREAVPKYRNVIISRINPLVRRMEHQGGDCRSFADRLVGDYARRNFVTAGGWAIEALPPQLNPLFQKSGTRGVDLSYAPPGMNEHSMYVLKSGKVTRNSDIVATLKRHARDAEKLLRQSDSKVKITLNYVISIGKITSTFEDGIHRPSSAEFWQEVTCLPQKGAVALVLAIAAAAGPLVESDASAHVRAMETMVAAYLGAQSDPTEVDWDFLGVRLFQAKSIWATEDKRRNALAVAALAATGYGETKKVAEEAAAEELRPESEQDVQEDVEVLTDEDEGGVNYPNE